MKKPSEDLVLVLGVSLVVGTMVSGAGVLFVILAYLIAVAN